MATCAFLLAPARAVPTTTDRTWMALVQSWTVASDARWAAHVEELPQADQDRTPWCGGGPRLSRNLADATRSEERAIVASARAWTDAAWQRFVDGGRAGPAPDNGLVTAQQALGLDSRVSTADLVGYRGGFKPLAPRTLTRGGVLGFVHVTKEDNAYAFAEAGSTERVLFEEIARGHGGDHLAVWTFGQAVHVWLASSPGPGQRPAVHGPFSFRLRAGRRAPDLAPMLAALGASAFTPDRAALEAALAAPVLPVPTWFGAFGIAGVKPVVAVDAAALWADFDQVRAQVQARAAVDAKAVARVDAAIARFGQKLPRKVSARGDAAAAFARVELALTWAVGGADRPRPVDPGPGPTDDQRYRAAMRARTFALVAAPPAAHPVAGWRALVDALGPTLAYGGRLGEVEGGFVAFQVHVPDATPAQLLDLRTALQGDGLVGSYGQVWLEPDGVVGAMCANLDVALLASVLADLPTGSRLHVAVGPDRAVSFTRA